MRIETGINFNFGVVMNIGLYKYSAKACFDVYDNHTDLGLTQCRHYIATINGRRFQVLSIAGTNEALDWFSNLNLFSWCGIKIGAYLSAKKIHKHYKKILKNHQYLPLLVTGHSLGGATALAFKKKYGCAYCIAFAPARTFRYWVNRKLSNTTIFIDPDDIVTKLGFISFGHPICGVVKARENHEFYSIGDHVMKHWLEFTGKMTGDGSA